MTQIRRIPGEIEGMRQEMEWIRADLRSSFEQFRKDAARLEISIKEELHTADTAYHAGAVDFGTLGLLVGLILGLFIAGKR